MAAVGFPPGISHAFSNVPILNELSPPSPSSGPLPIPYPNNAHFTAAPFLPVLEHLFGSTTTDLLGAAPQTDLSLG